MPRSIIYIWISLILFLAALYVALHVFAMRSFVELEKQSMSRNLGRMLRSIEQERTYISRKSSDWAAWDDAYQFVQDRNPRFIRSNIVLSAFTGIDLNLIAYADSFGKIIYARWYEPGSNRLSAVPEEITEALQGCSLLIRHTDVRSAVSGILMVRKGPLLVASRPVITSNEQGPIRGSVVFGRLLDEDEVKRLSQLVGISAEVKRLDEAMLSESYARARAKIWKRGQTVIKPVSRSTIAGYALIEDVYEKPALILRVEQPRPIYRKALAVMNYSLGALAILSLMFGLMDTLLILRSARHEREYDEKTHEFYRQTITAATGEKLVVSDHDAIERMCDNPTTTWDIRDASNLPDIRSAAQDMAISSGIDEDRAWRFATGVGEAVTNAIKHAGGGRAHLCRRPDKLVFVISDHGPGIPALRLPDVALRRGYSTAGTLGMGYKIMISFMDKVYLATGPKGTSVAIEMQIKPDERPVGDLVISS